MITLSSGLLGRGGLAHNRAKETIALAVSAGAEPRVVPPLCSLLANIAFDNSFFITAVVLRSGALLMLRLWRKCGAASRVTELWGISLIAAVATVV
jgi:hypothetical protein